MAKTGKKKKIIIISVVSLVVVCALIIGGVLLLKGRSKPVNVYSMQNIAMDSYWGDTSETEGMVRTDKMQSVYVSTTQIVTETFVTEGQQVKAGDKLLSFDTTLSDIELERQRLTVEKLELRLKSAQNELKKINSYKPYVEPTPEPGPEPEPLEPMPLPYLIGGQGTLEKPYIFLWDETCWYTDNFVNGILPLKQVEIPENEENTENPDEENEAAPANETVTYEENSVWVVFENRESANPKGELISLWGINFTRNSDGSYKFSMYTPEPGYNSDFVEKPAEEPEIPEPVGPQYTASEIARMREETQKEIADLTLQIKVEKVKYEQLQLEVSSGIVTAQLDGIVKTVTDPEEAMMNSTPYIVVSGGGGYYIQGALSELELETVMIGQTVEVYSWMSGNMAQGEIVEISEYPDTNGYHWSNGNQNVSFYPFTVYVNEDSALQENEYVSIRYSAAQAEGGIYLEKPFIITENSKSYVYVKDENGKLEKREVSVGKSIWGSYTEILGGLTMDDFVAFPYGKNIKAGADTVEAGLDELYSYGF